MVVESAAVEEVLQMSAAGAVAVAVVFVAVVFVAVGNAGGRQRIRGRRIYLTAAMTQLFLNRVRNRGPRRVTCWPCCWPCCWPSKFPVW